MSTTPSLDAGAILPPDTPDATDGAAGGTGNADALTARTYRHPALEERAVVRLVAETLGEAEDLALGYLGLARDPDTPLVGRVRRETLGFPAWALVNDPANGHHALALVQDIERLSRMAAARAGAAKDAFEALGDQLGRSAPHFLPTFYEQAARVFLGHDNTRYAATFFGKARAAERMHGLEVDEERHRAVFLEFAYAGALTVSALKEHVRDLVQRLDPTEAWEQFRRLTVERCAAGLPPYSSLPGDVRKLLRATGLDVAAEERALLGELLASPAIDWAPRTFWTGYHDHLAALAAEQPEIRARFLTITPSGLASGEELGDDVWLALLAATGADALLTGDAPASGTAAADDPADSPADWLGRWAKHLSSGWRSPRRSARTYALVRRMAPRLRADGRRVVVCNGRRWGAGVDLELLDVCLTEGIPVADPPQDLNLSLDGWFDAPADERRDLTAVVADSRFVSLLREAVGQTGRDHRSDRQKIVAAHPVLRELLRDWLGAAAETFLAARGLPSARKAIDTLLPFAPVAADVAPDVTAALAAHDLAPLVTATLRTGIVDELGWPALEEALRLFPEADFGRGAKSLVVCEAWPALVVGNVLKAVVVGPDRILLEHDVRIPDQLSWEQPSFHWTDGELLVTWWHDGAQRAYWSARPTEIFELTAGNARNSGSDVSLPLPDGGRTTGGRPFRAGDTAMGAQRRVAGDGTGFWRLEHHDGAPATWHEFDPATGEGGRASLPAFFAQGIAEGGSLHPDLCSLMPLAPGYEHTPLGTDGRLLGAWVRRDEDAPTLTAGSVDGRTATVGGAPTGRSQHPRVLPVGRLGLPGDASPVLLAGATAGLAPDGADLSRDITATFEPAKKGGQFAAGTPLVPPLTFWHALLPRDEAGSGVLRAMTDETARRLVSAVSAAGDEQDRLLREAAEAGRERPAEESAAARAVALDSAVTSVLAGVSDPALRKGLAGIAAFAERLDASVKRLVSPAPDGPGTRVASMFEDHEPPHGTNATLHAALAGLSTPGGYWTSGSWSVIQQILATSHILAGKPTTGKPLPARLLAETLPGGWTTDAATAPAGSHDWPGTLAHLPALAYRATTATLPDEEREALLLLLTAFADGPLSGDSPLRVVELTTPGTTHTRGGQVLRHGERTVVVLGTRTVNRAQNRTTWFALDHDPAAAFGAVAHFTVGAEQILPARPSGEWLGEIVRLIRRNGPAPWDPEAATRLAGATGLGPAQAALLLAALPAETPAPLLAVLGTKAGVTGVAAQLLQALPAEAPGEVVAALLPERAEDLWRTGADTDAAARVWRTRLGDRHLVPEDVALEMRLNATAAAVLNPTLTRWLSRTTRQTLNTHSRPTPDDPSALPAYGIVPVAVGSLAALAYALPDTHPVRAALPGALDALRNRLADPGLVMDIDIEWTEKGGPTAKQLREIHGLPEDGGAGTDGMVRIGDAFVAFPWYGSTEATWLRPAGVKGPDDPALGLIEGIVGPRCRSHLIALRALLGDDLSRAVRAGTDAAGEGYAQDPARSVPGLVAEVAAAHGLGDDAAVLYLQLLALPDPTDRNRARWTGWRPARAKRAAAELAETPLVVTAQRSRAGRRLFLPGGWADLKAPALPVETWKGGLYPLPATARAVPHIPVAELFHRAWQRVGDGDAPAYEELVTRATRKARR
ncbi:hypothetical protein [Streptomyces avicenniae]|uniref:hypothetical protein n=1 Tax=Streptomyces avicenniae TaxID=500153 RepID=UPI00069C1570|nr:hypothetical protein [Streptomyces avicenniae]